VAASGGESQAQPAARDADPRRIRASFGLKLQRYLAGQSTRACFLRRSALRVEVGLPRVP
jgi:hypothetical protein